MDKLCQQYLSTFCDDIQVRPVGSCGNRQATDFFQNTATSFGWEVKTTTFPAMDWREDGGDIQIEDIQLPVIPSPYSRGCDVLAELTSAATVEELETGEFQGKILLLHGELTREQLMPKNFKFYNPPDHQRIIALLEKQNPAAILAATNRNAALAGGIYPFPLIEDGDFEIPSTYIRQEEGNLLLAQCGNRAHITSRAERISTDSDQLVASKGIDSGTRYVVSAHIDAKIGTPGAIDNATGVVVLLLLAGLLSVYEKEPVIELLPFNGEDYYSAPGQVLYLDHNREKMDEVKLNINIDGAGFHEGPTAISLFDLPSKQEGPVRELIGRTPGIQESVPWYQGDHSIFLQQGVPAIAATSQWFLDNLDSQQITHTPADHPGIVDCQKVTRLAGFLSELLLALTN